MGSEEKDIRVYNSNLVDEKLRNIFNDFLDDKNIIKYIGRYYDVSTPRECFNKEAIETIEFNIKFFKDIPQNKLECVFISLTEIFQHYDVSSQNQLMVRMINEYLPIYDKKPTLKIKEDIQTIKNFKEVFSRIVNFTEISKEIPNMHNILNKIVNDLEKKEFNIISKNKYYRPSRMDKTELKDFFKKLRNNFNLKGVSLEEKALIDGFTSYIKTTKKLDSST